MIEFKQIIGRGTRLFDGKNYFTIYDFVDAYHHFADPEWDGEPEAVENYNPREKKESFEVRDSDNPEFNFVSEEEPKQKIVIKLASGKEIQSTMKTLFFVINQFQRKSFCKIYMEDYQSFLKTKQN